MNHLHSTNRYLAPKWRAYVTPGEDAFIFSNGIRVASFWELKQALLTLPEDVVNGHVSQDKNDIAAWVEGVVGDKEMAEEMRQQSHRWGMIVTLERQMMRTLELPDYVAKRWLKTVSSPFVFMTGEKIQSIAELASVLDKIGDDTVAFHCERFPNDMAVWMADIVGDYELAELLNEATSRMQMKRFVDDHMEMLQEAAE